MKLKTKFISGFLGIAALVAVLGVINIQIKKTVDEQFNKITASTARQLIALYQIKVDSVTITSKVYSYTVITGGHVDRTYLSYDARYTYRSS